jgi:hypothetical protein
LAANFFTSSPIEFLKIVPAVMGRLLTSVTALAPSGNNDFNKVLELEIGLCF